MNNENQSLFKEAAQDIHTLSYYRFLHTSSWVETQVKEALKKFGLTHSQLNVLYLLVQHDPTPMAVNTIKEKLIVNNPDITRLLDRLVKKGYISRETCPTNRRKIDILVTETGRQVFYNAHLEAKAAVKNFFKEALTREEAVQLYEILKKISL